ncbi:HAD superfamily hydrolase (TIGR01484 family) [Branchiibius hedensis]|uniref:HAD-superfamily hydrolase, subfamily IIB n=1 Tax=Branchiibius hedensis TaxID=672460 RepID=A0A2Y8ZUH7_9MICO|nr:HAD superfamily hydrolase (TIGR01484 family) [Branchiibius hedensis]SSA36070.1 HAD-superfamily hydrolase, subfamily IIB [Branchiibius hedensis]
MARRGAPYSDRVTRLLVALDIDGTLLHFDGTMSDAVRDAVRAVADAGHHVVIATGRSVIAATPVAEHIGLASGYLVCSNGAVTISLDPSAPAGYHLVETVTFDPGPVLGKLRDAWPDATVAVEVLGEGFLLSAPFPEGELNGVQKVVSWEELAQQPTTRLTFRSSSGTAEDFLELAERLGLHEVNYAVGFSAWLDINPEGVSKASALEQVRRFLGIEPCDTVAVGDHRNDLEMLEWAARGVAMGQAPDEVKAVADEVTGTIEQDGAATVLRSLL